MKVKRRPGDIIVQEVRIGSRGPRLYVQNKRYSYQMYVLNCHLSIDVVETAVEALHKIKKALNHHRNLGFICLLPNTFPYQGFLFVCNTLHTLSRIHTYTRTYKNHYVNRYRPNSTATLYVEAPFERPEVGYLQRLHRYKMSL